MQFSQYSPGGTPLYKLYRYVLPHRVFWCFCAVLVWKRVYTLTILVWDRAWFLRELRSVWTYLSFQFQISKEEREICEFQIGLKNVLFALQSKPKGQVWKREWILEVWTENGCGNWHFLVWNRVRIWRTGRHTPTKNSQEYPPREYRATLTYSDKICTYFK